MWTMHILYACGLVYDCLPLVMEAYRNLQGGSIEKLVTFNSNPSASSCNYAYRSCVAFYKVWPNLSLRTIKSVH